MGNVFITIKLMRVRVICKLADWGHEQRPGVRGFLGEERGGGRRWQSDDARLRNKCSGAEEVAKGWQRCGDGKEAVNECGGMLEAA